MTKTVRDKILVESCRVILAFIFIGASIYKIATPMAFAQQIYNYKILPVMVINPIANTVSWLQLVCGLLLLFRIWIREVSLVIMLLMGIFQAAVASALIRGLNISCGCFSGGGSPATWITFGRDFAILMLSIFVFIKSVFTDKRFGLRLPI